ncbi:MAG: RNA-binding domain-containing protein [Desulfurococcaceae archaeon]|uniref:UPF0201 protein ENU20_02650 n=1 Tax=Staphylothermus marinus TaxID=2280 RepID=A0A7C4JLC7_STAMA
MVRVRVEAVVKPTEDLEKVKRAVMNVFDGELNVIDLGNGYYIVEGVSNDLKSISKLKQMIVSFSIGPATRSYMFRRIRGNTLEILLHKQALLIGKLSFIDSDKESPLGAIKIVIEAEDPGVVVNEIAPSS